MECTKTYQISCAQDFCRVCYLGVLYRGWSCYLESLQFVCPVQFSSRKKFISLNCKHLLACNILPPGMYILVFLLKISFHCQILLLYFFAFLNSILWNYSDVRTQILVPLQMCFACEFNHGEPLPMQNRKGIWYSGYFNVMICPISKCMLLVVFHIKAKDEFLSS